MIPETEISSLYINFIDLDESMYNFKGKYTAILVNLIDDYHVTLTQWTMTTEVVQWCRENHIKYRKVTMGNSIFNSKRQVIEYIGEKYDGVLFYSPEDATAFDLRWL